MSTTSKRSTVVDVVAAEVERRAELAGVRGTVSAIGLARAWWPELVLEETDGNVAERIRRRWPRFVYRVAELHVARANGSCACKLPDCAERGVTMPSVRYLGGMTPRERQRGALYAIVGLVLGELRLLPDWAPSGAHYAFTVRVTEAACDRLLRRSVVRRGGRARAPLRARTGCRASEGVSS